MAGVEVSKKTVARLGKKTLALLLIACSLSGCTTWRPVPSEPKSISTVLRPGDELRLTTRDSRVRELTVREITGLSISGEQEQVPLSDIARMERREFSPGKTAGLVGGVLGTAILTYAVIFLATVSRNGL